LALNLRIAVDGGGIVLVRFTTSVRVRMWGKELRSFGKGELHTVPMAVAAVLFAQRCAEPVADPPEPARAQVA
jgi:hypothetical protein